MKTIFIDFRNDSDRGILILTFILSMGLMFIPPLLTFFLAKEYLSESAMQTVKSLFNFELLLFLIGLISIIPIIGWLLSIILIPLIAIYNIIIIVINMCSMAKNNEVKIPVMYEFL